MASMKFSGLIDQNHSMRMAAATSSYVKWKIVGMERLFTTKEEHPARDHSALHSAA